MSDTPAEVFPPGEFIRDEMAARGWGVHDLAARMGVGYTIAYQVAHGGWMTLGIADALGRAFGTSAAFWLNLQRLYEEGRK